MAVFVAEGLTVALAGGWGLVAVRVGVARVGTGALVEAAGGLLVGVPDGLAGSARRLRAAADQQGQSHPSGQRGGQGGSGHGPPSCPPWRAEAKSGGDITRMPDGHSSAQGRATVAVSFLGRGAGAGTCAAGTSAV